jgi:hypothetical protein
MGKNKIPQVNGKTPRPAQEWWNQQNTVGIGKQHIPSAREVVNAAIAKPKAKK